MGIEKENLHASKTNLKIERNETQYTQNIEELHPALTAPFTGFGSTDTLAATVAAAAEAAAAAADAARSCCLRRAPRLLVGLRVAGVPAPMGVASLSDEAAAFTRTAGSGKMNSCAHSGGNLRLQFKRTTCVSIH